MFFTTDGSAWPLNRSRHIPSPVQPLPIPLPSPGIPDTDWRVPMSPRAGLSLAPFNLLRPLVLPASPPPFPWSPTFPSPPPMPNPPPRWKRDNHLCIFPAKYIPTTTIHRHIDRLNTPSHFLPSMTGILEGQPGETPTPRANAWPPSELTPLAVTYNEGEPEAIQSPDTADTSISPRSTVAVDPAVKLEIASRKSSSSTSDDNLGAEEHGEKQQTPRPSRFTEHLDISATAEWLDRKLSVESGYEADAE